VLPGFVGILNEGATCFLSASLQWCFTLSVMLSIGNELWYAHSVSRSGGFSLTNCCRTILVQWEFAKLVASIAPAPAQAVVELTGFRETEAVWTPARRNLLASQIKELGGAVQDDDDDRVSRLTHCVVVPGISGCGLTSAHRLRSGARTTKSILSTLLGNWMVEHTLVLHRAVYVGHA
jgi:hypothetical protein